MLKYLREQPFATTAWREQGRNALDFCFILSSNSISLSPKVLSQLKASWQKIWDDGKLQEDPCGPQRLAEEEREQNTSGRHQ